jgi:SAM-dependent methyltransferase
VRIRKENTIASNRVRCSFCGRETNRCEMGIFDTRFGLSPSYDIVYCASCKLEQIVPLPSPKRLRELYEKYYNFGGEHGTCYTRLRKRFFLSSLYRLWLAFDGDISFHTVKGTGMLIDIGCNEGRGLIFYEQNGFTPEGIEPNERAAAVANSEKFTIYTEPIEMLQQNNVYDVAVLSNVLEHSLDPKKMLLQVHRILKSGGQLWISCPNSESWLRKFFGKFWINWHVPFHTVHFSVSGLQKILVETQFSVVKLRQETPSLWVAHSLITRLYAKRGRPTQQLRNPLLIIFLMVIIRGLFFPILWIGNLLRRGDCVLVIAQKRCD